MTVYDREKSTAQPETLTKMCCLNIDCGVKEWLTRLQYIYIYVCNNSNVNIIDEVPFKTVGLLLIFTHYQPKLEKVYAINGWIVKPLDTDNAPQNALTEKLFSHSLFRLALLLLCCTSQLYL